MMMTHILHIYILQLLCVFPGYSPPPFYRVHGLFFSCIFSCVFMVVVGNRLPAVSPLRMHRSTLASFQTPEKETENTVAINTRLFSWP